MAGLNAVRIVIAYQPACEIDDHKQFAAALRWQCEQRILFPTSEFVLQNAVWHKNRI
ncbi:MAG: hypothetical protein ABI557_04485 [Aureliella sp.]